MTALTEMLGMVGGALLIFGITFLAFWHRDRVLYILTGFAWLLFGFDFYRTSAYVSIILAMLGIYCFVKAAWDRKKASE